MEEEVSLIDLNRRRTNGGNGIVIPGEHGTVVVSDYHFVDIELHGYPFNWECGWGTRNWVEVRIVRALVSPSWMSKYPLATLYNLEISQSDHYPLLLEPKYMVVPISRSLFCFENAWLREPLHGKIVQENWAACLGTSWASKVDLCNSNLAKWGKEITSNFCNRIKSCSATLQRLKSRKDSNSIRQFAEESRRMTEILHRKEIYWRQWSKQLWLKDGDKNSKYFHASTTA
ncbi:uncharacterized protein LOC133778992 [Humulus lupulus]|uniref:uncharacterized protein LOC133778992 n=1 Tax=Humulus lupulus TaxID=3486 RepID=UPI002B407AFD|nr:uncharacterized protein LOC133778992 [Humulus lupulus]